MVIWCVGESGAPPLKTSDAEILVWCENKHFTLVTNNRATMPVHLRAHLEAGDHIPGIIILKRNMVMKEIVEELVLIWEVAEPDEYTEWRITEGALSVVQTHRSHPNITRLHRMNGLK